MKGEQTLKLDKSLFDQVLTILKEETGTTAHLMAAVPVGGGSINQCFHLQTTKGSYFLKTKENAPPAFFEKEARGLLLLSRAGAQVPHVMASSDTFLLLEWIPKGSWTPSRMKELGRQLALVHQKQHKMFGLEEDNYIGLLPQPNHPSDNWLTFYREQRLGQQFAFALERGKIHPSFT
jgi:fructosamine-3-kinase